MSRAGPTGMALGPRGACYCLATRGPSATAVEVRSSEGLGLAFVCNLGGTEFEEVVVIVDEVERTVLGAVTWFLEPEAKLSQMRLARLELDSCDI